MFFKSGSAGTQGFCRLTRDFICRLFYFETEANNSGYVHNVVKSWGALLIFSNVVHGSEFEQKTLCSPTCVILFWPAKPLFTSIQNGCFFGVCNNDK